MDGLLSFLLRPQPSESASLETSLKSQLVLEGKEDLI